MDPAMRLAACVTFGRFDGGEWDWNTLSWKERR